MFQSSWITFVCNISCSYKTKQCTKFLYDNCQNNTLLTFVHSVYLRYVHTVQCRSMVWQCDTPLESTTRKNTWTLNSSHHSAFVGTFWQEKGVTALCLYSGRQRDSVRRCCSRDNTQQHVYLYIFDETLHCPEAKVEPEPTLLTDYTGFFL